MSILTMEEPLRDSFAAPITHSVRNRTKQYEEALRAFQVADFVRAQDLLEALIQDTECRWDGAADLLLKRTRKYIASDGKSVTGISADELARWDGIYNLSEK